MRGKVPLFEELESRLLLSVFYVDDTPGEFQQFSTIQAAVNAAGPGDTVYVKEGLYRETVSITVPATAGAPFVLRAYPGDEGLVTVSGAAAITGWRQATGPSEVQGNANWQNIYIADVSFEVTQLLHEGQALPPSRYGQVGQYRYPTGIISNRAFYDATLPGADGYWVGAIVHIKCSYWRIDHHRVSSFTDSTGRIDLATSNTADSFSTKFGYFLTNIVGEIKADGEWAYKNGKVYLMSISGPPVGIEASQRDDGVFINGGASYVTVQGLTVEGTKNAGFYVGVANHVTVADNAVYHSVLYGILATQGGADHQIVNNDIRYCGYAGIRLRAPRSLVEGNYIYGIGTDTLGGDVLSGTGGMGIFVIDAEDSVLFNNRIDRTGNNGIEVTNWEQAARGITISYNHITNVMLATDDGGGIYFGLLTAGNTKWDVVDHNIVQDCWGFYEGTPRAGQPREYMSQAHGIYVDNTPLRADHIRITDNTVINAYHAGLLLYDPFDTEASGNTVYSSKQMQVLYTDWQSYSEDVLLQENIFYSTDDEQYVFVCGNRSDGLDADYNYLQDGGRSESMIFMERDLAPLTFIEAEYDLAAWQSLRGLEVHSVALSPPVGAGSQILINPTLETVVADPGQYCLDMFGQPIEGPVTLGPFESMIVVLPLAGDVDIDGNVDYEDYKQVLQNFGASGATRQQGDLDRDGDVDYEDYKQILTGFGGVATAGGIAAPPTILLNQQQVLTPAPQAVEAARAVAAPSDALAVELPATGGPTEQWPPSPAPTAAPVPQVGDLVTAALDGSVETVAWEFLVEPAEPVETHADAEALPQPAELDGGLEDVLNGPSLLLLPQGLLG